MSIYKKIISFIEVSDETPEFNVERFRLASKQVPLLYAILVVNLFTVSYTNFYHAPVFLTIVIPIILSAIVIRRAIIYHRASNQEITGEAATKWLRSTVHMSMFMGIFFTAWALSIIEYGNVSTQSHVALLACITILSCSFCLTHIRQAAILLTLTVAPPIAIFFFLSDETVLKAISINLLLVGGLVLFVMNRHYHDFKKQALQQKALKHQSNKLETLNSENQLLANLDSLTNLPNRRSFFSHLTLMTEQMSVEQRTLVVGSLDLDGFKSVNDVFGHAAGDRLLVKVSEHLRDLLDENVFVARLGGDEFGLIITDPKNDEEVLDIGRKICAALKLPIEIKEGTVQIAGTIGFAGFPEAAKTPQELFERADYALHYSKQHSKGKPLLFSSEHETIIREASAISHRLNEANLDEEMSIVFQPIMDTRTNRTSGFEALARWDNPIIGKVNPEVFICAAERTGIISQMTVVLLKKALEYAEEWPDDIYLSFNLSALDLSSPTSILRLMRIVENSNFPASRIVFEITESAVMQDFERSYEALQLLRRLGATIALDDFGTGYSSLSYIQRLPIDRLKIDRSFIIGIEDNKATQNIVHAILSLCENLELDCVVEGIESKVQLQTIQDLGCHLIQGYLFSKPMQPADALVYAGRVNSNSSALSA